MYLSQFNSGRDNNFNLLRFIAASLVLFSHSFALSTGSAAAEPLRESLGITWGIIAVDAFFITSGFLVTGSLLVRNSLLEFVTARVLRIYPGLWVALGITVFVLGPCVTTLGLADYLAHPETWTYLLKNGSVLKAAHTLPGVFEDLPWKNAVNGSLWTLPIEVRMYGSLAVLWLVARMLPGSAARNFCKFCVAVAALTAFAHLLLAAVDRHQIHVRLGYMFFSGAAMRMLQNHVSLSLRIAAPMVLAVLVAATNKTAFDILYPLCIPYLVLYLAFVPRGRIRRFNQFGDCSYGIYIYAYPVQQLLVLHWRGINPYELMIASFVITFIVAIASWELVEKRALALKRQVKVVTTERRLQGEAS